MSKTPLSHPERDDQVMLIRIKERIERTIGREEAAY
jgi:hypothetical protein